MGETVVMNDGDGAHSSAKSSLVHYKKQASDAVKGMIQSAVIENLDAEISGTFRIADLRSSVGAKSFVTVEDLIEAVGNKYSSSKNLEFQVFFNNHLHNDFNTLFASLPPERQFYAAGVPGSFHRCLFPSDSITIAFSSHALHWLSDQPKLGLTNAGRIHDTGASEDVVRAYSDHFAADLADFLNARAAEIVRGGLMFVMMPATRDDDDDDGGGASLSELRVVFDYLGSALMEMAEEGGVERSAVDAFNLPLHFPKLREMKKGVEKNGCFSIEIMEFSNTTSSSQISVGSLLGHMRLGMDGIFTSHFGASVVDEMFAKTSAKAEEITHCFEGPQYKSSQLFVVLKRI